MQAILWQPTFGGVTLVSDKKTGLRPSVLQKIYKNIFGYFAHCASAGSRMKF